MMENVISGLNFTPISREVFVVTPALDVDAKLPKDEDLLLGGVYRGGEAVLQLVFRPAGRLGTSVASLCWLGLIDLDGGAKRDAFSVQPLPELRVDDQIKNLLSLPSYKKAVRELAKFKSDPAKSAYWSRLRHGSLKDVGLALAGAITKLGVGFALLAVIFLLYVKTVDLDVRIQALGNPAFALPQQGSGVPSQKISQLGQPQLKALHDLIRGSSISRFSDGDPIVMLSDPNCPACRAFEDRMKKDGWPLTPLIVPVAFQSGSQEAVAGVLCSKNRVKAWDQAVAGKVQQGCEEGRLQVALNNEAFGMMQLDSTPTFVSMSGHVFRGASDLQALLAWARENSPGGKIGQR